MTPIGSLEQSVGHSRADQFRKLAKDIEAQFLAQMLKTAGVGKPRESFGGGPGEDQFSSFLVQEYAVATVDAGGIGLSEAIFNSLVKKGEAHGHD